MNLDPICHTPKFFIDFKEGDHLAFKKFFDSTVAQLTHIIIAKCEWARPCEIEDFVADAYCEVYANRAKYERVDHICASLVTIAWHRAIDYEEHRVVQWRLERRWWGEHTNQSVQPNSSDADQAILDQVKKIKTAVEQLGNQAKAVFKLAFYEDKSVEEISNILGLAKPTVYSYRLKAIEKVRKLLNITKPALSVYDTTNQICTRSYKALVQARCRARRKANNYCAI